MVTASAAELHPTKHAGLRVLVVEDDPDTRRTMQTLLGFYGHTVRVVPSGHAGLAAAWSWDPDVVLLDIALGGMSGYEVAHSLRQRAIWKRPLLVAVTGLGHAEAHRRSAEAGIDLHLLKPVDPEQLQAVLARFERVIGGRDA